MKKILILLPDPLKAKLDAVRNRGYTINGFVRALLERELASVAPASKKQRAS